MRHLIPEEEERVRAWYVINELIKNNLYNCLAYKEYSREGDSPADSWIDENLVLLANLHLRFSSGCTKVCIFDEENPYWVIKIGFIRSTSEYFVKNNLCFDFVEKEVEFYARAVDKKLDKFFAATYKLGEVFGMTVCLQEAVSPDCGMLEDIFSDYVSDWYSKDSFSSEDDYNDQVWSDVEDLGNDDRIYAIFGSGEEAQNLVDFIDENEINDLHGGNWGVTEDNSIVMMDFSGFVD